MKPSAEQLERRLRYLEADPDNTGLLAECADLALALGRAEQSAALAERALARDPDDPYFRSRLASAKLAGGDADAAIGLFRGLVEAGETSPEVRYNLGYACLLAGRYEEAKSVLEPLAHGGRDVPGAALLLARAHHYLGDLAGAIELAQAYEQSHPGDAHASAQLAMLHFDAADLDAATQWCEKALAPGVPETPEARFTAGFLALARDDQDAADAHLARALELNPRSGRAWAGKGLAAMLRGDLRQAEGALRQALELMPKHIGTWHALAWCRLLAGDLDGAEEAFRRSLEIDRSFGETHGGLAVIALQRGDRQEAETRSKTALRLDPQSMAAQYARLLLDPKLADPHLRERQIRVLLASQRTADGGTLLDLVGRHAARRGSRK